MKIQVITLFPEMFEGVLGSSMLWKARERCGVEYSLIDLRQFGIGPRNQVDDTPYGGGDGMLMRPEPIIAAIEHAKQLDSEASVMLPTPRGKIYKQSDAKRLALNDKGIIIVCPRYEGYDERITNWIDVQYCIGNYVLTGGEIPAMVLIDSVVRLLPGVLGSENSAEIESFQADDKTIEFPQYTRPEEFRELRVPDVLLSGHHAEILKWQEKIRNEKIGWSVPVESRGFEGIVIGSDSLKLATQTAVNETFSVITNVYDLTDSANSGLQDRFENLNYVFREHSELGASDFQASLGSVVLTNLIKFPIKNESKNLSLPKAPSTVFLTADSFGEELDNLVDALGDYCMDKDNDEDSSMIEVSELLVNESLMLETAVKLAISRRLLKYGVLPDEYIKPGHKEIGFDRWVNETVIPNRPEKSAKINKKIIMELYVDDLRVAKNLRRTVWTEMFHALIPLSAKVHQVFFMRYLNVLTMNSKNTALFNDPLTSRVDSEDVTRVFEDIYGTTPRSFKLVK